jgi:hypothetical protein
MYFHHQQPQDAVQGNYQLKYTPPNIEKHFLGNSNTTLKVFKGSTTKKKGAKCIQQ